MMEIALTRGKIALIDDEDFELVRSISWCFDPGSRSRLGYAKAKTGGKTIYMHRLILGAKRADLVDHINRNSLDNRRCNLRLATRAQNAANTNYAPSECGFRGVHPARGKFRALIEANKKRYRGPSRASALLAAKDYDRLALQLHGEFAITNFPAEHVQ